MSSIRETVDGLRGGGRGWTLLFVAIGWLFISGFRIVLPAILPQIKADFVVDNASAGFALTVLWGLYALMQFPSGIVADRVGERALLVAGTFLGAISFGLFYLTPAFVLFLVVCGTFGIGAGLFGTPRDMYLSRIYPTADNTAYALTFATGSLGAAILPYVGTVIATQWNWRLAVVWLFPPLVVAGAGILAIAPSEGRERETERLSAGRTVRETARALSDRSVLAGSGVMILAIFTYQALLSFLPTYLLEIKSLDQGTVALLYGFVFVASAVVQPAAGHLADQYGERGVLLTLILFSTATLGALPFVDARIALTILVPLLGVRIAIAPLVTAFVVRELPQPIRGTGWGLLRTLFFAIGATGSSVIGLFADAGRFDAGFLALAALTGIAALFWLAIPADRFA